MLESITKYRYSEVQTFVTVMCLREIDNNALYDMI